ncbi:RsmE family RNA methyltransferase [Roseimaritima sediminicola]|uniref:RsmE family RNA methyltransferase n=1 Tax=Roseimaritima sediminicola TaxID=2662066 RepID=UPI0012982CD1|nr:RsmE family RNA methyltransferase [Roseimaritima sediminicola]
MTQRYYVPDLPAAGGVLELPEAEGHHARTVMRLRVGDAVELFDGRGTVATAEITAVSKRQVTCEAQPCRRRGETPRRSVTVAVGMPKGDRAKFLIEKLTELGVTRCVPLRCQRSQWTVSSGALQKWQRAMIEACKQSGRNDLMEIAAPVAAETWLAAAGEAAAWRLLAHPAAAEGGQLAVGFTQAGQPSSPEQGVAIAVGPEGGFVEEEVRLATQAGWQAVSLGELVYRIETAAIVLAALAMHR